MPPWPWSIIWPPPTSSLTVSPTSPASSLAGHGVPAGLPPFSSLPLRPASVSDASSWRRQPAFPLARCPRTLPRPHCSHLLLPRQPPLPSFFFFFFAQILLPDASGGAAGLPRFRFRFGRGQVNFLTSVPCLLYSTCFVQLIVLNKESICFGGEINQDHNLIQCPLAKWFMSLVNYFRSVHYLMMRINQLLEL